MKLIASSHYDKAIELPCGRVIAFLHGAYEDHGIVYPTVWDNRDEYIRGSNRVHKFARCYWAKLELDTLRQQLKDTKGLLDFAKEQIDSHRQFLKALLKMDDLGGRDDLNWYIFQHLSGIDPFADQEDE